MIAQDNILPEAGNPNGLAGLIMEFRTQAQREALAQSTLQRQQQLMQGDIIEQQMNRLKLDALPGEIARGQKLGEQRVRMGQQELEISAEELTAARRKNGVLGRLKEAKDLAFDAMNSLAKVNEINQRTRTSKLNADILENELRAFDPKTPEGIRLSITKLTQLLADPQQGDGVLALAEYDPALVAQGFPGLPPEVITGIATKVKQARLDAAEQKERLSASERMQRGQVDMVRAAVSTGNWKQADSAVRRMVDSNVAARQALAKAATEDERKYIYNSYMFDIYQGLGIDRAQGGVPEEGQSQPEPQTSAPQTGPGRQPAPMPDVTRPQQVPQQASNRPVVTTQAEYDALAPGTEFISAKTGQLRRKPMEASNAQPTGR